MPKYNVKDTQFLYGTAGSAPSVVIADIEDGDVTFGEVGKVDVSPYNASRQTEVATIKDSMSGTLNLIWGPAEATHAYLMSAYLAKTKISIGFKPRTNDATPTNILHRYGDAFIINVSPPIAVEGNQGKMSCSVMFKFAGAYQDAS